MTAISADGLSKQYRIGQLDAGYGTLRESIVHATRRVLGREPRHDDQERKIWALKDVSFAVDEGSAVGIIGRNGAGKSTLLKVLTRITTPTEGRAEIRGRVGSLLEVGTGFHPELTGRENVFLNGSILGMRRREITQKFADIVEFAGIEKFMDTPVKRYSSGMYVRLAFSVAAHLEPEILLVDEVLAVGDAEFQKRCLGRMEELGNSGRTVALRLPQHAGDRAALRSSDLARAGAVVEDGPSSELVANYLQSGHGTGGESRAGPTDDGPGRRPRPASLCPRRPGRRGSAGRRCSASGRDRGRLRRSPRRRAADLPQDQARRPARRCGVQRHGYERALAGDRATGRVRLDGLDTGQSPQRGPDRRAGRDLRPSQRRSFCRTPGANVSFHVQDFGEGDSAKGLFTGQWKGVVRPLLDWTTEEV